MGRQQEREEERVARRLQQLQNQLNPKIQDMGMMTNKNTLKSETPMIGQEATCGIVGIISKEPTETERILMDGLTILQNRGYDSAGICTMKPDKNELHVTKFASRETTSDALDQLRKTLPEHKQCKLGIAHTRWATHGGKTDYNAHPHMDDKNRVAIIHNGVIENSAELKKQFIDQAGIQCRSETDTEVIVQLIGLRLDEGDSLNDAVKNTVSLLEGTWGLLIISTEDPSQIICCQNGSPLLLGIGQDKLFIASESSAFSRYTRQLINLENNDIVAVDYNGIKTIIQGDSGISSRVSTAPDTDIQLTPAPYPHWTIKEILEQPLALSRALNYGGRFKSETEVKLGGLDNNKKILGQVKHLIIAACGTSYYSGLYGARMMRHLHSFTTVRVVDAAELITEDFPLHNAGLLVISQSGETQDVIRCLRLAQQLDITVFSIVNRVGSTIARITGCGAYVNAGRENAVASTKAFTCQVTVLMLFATWFSTQNSPKNLSRRHDLVTSLQSLPLSVGRMLKPLRQRVKEIAPKLLNHNTMFLLGKGYGEHIAQEGALKIKEITYTHAEAYASGALKHGPFALIEQGTPIIIMVFKDQDLALNCTACHEIRGRGAYVIAVTDCPREVEEVCDDIIPIPHNGPLTPLNAVIPLQLLAYELSVLKKIDPDHPKNLAKCVTVL